MPKIFHNKYDNKYESNVVKKLTEEYTNLIEKEKYIDEPKLKKN